MRYEKPEIIILAPAIDAIQGGKSDSTQDNPGKDSVAAYEDWE
jgi:hypothetical protein